MRQAIITISLVTAIWLADCPRLSATVDWPVINLVPVASGLPSATHITNAGDGSGRLFVVQQTGAIRIIKNGMLLTTPFLDVSSRLSCCGERGLLSIAFPPSYATKGYFYIYYTDAAGSVTLARYFVTANPDVANFNSEQILLSIPHSEFANHNGGQLAFGPDGYLYMGTGDGGGGGDTLGNGQNTNALLGKILRLDVESGANPYAIPTSNPYRSTAGFRGEIWAYGVRNPFRFSFDRQTGDLYIGEVGQGLYEEVDFQPAASPGGQNYGWNIMEGFHCYNASSCSSTGLTLPVIEYDHSQGDCSIIGGFVYRGTQSARMNGVYFFSDYCTAKIRAAVFQGGAWLTNILYDAPFNVTTFGEDEAANLYLDDQGGGNIYMLADAGATTPTATPTATPTGTPNASNNDACAGAIVVDAAPFTNTSVTSSATADASDPVVGCGNGSRSKSVWYRFTAPSNGTLTANTLGSNYDTILAAYTGSCGAFTAVSGACNDDTTGTTQSQVSLTASGGSTYYFLISAYSNNGGSLTFHLTFQGAGPTATPTQTFSPAPPTATRTQTPLPTLTFTPGPPTATFTAGPPTATPTITPTRTSTPQLNDTCASAVRIDAAPYSSSRATNAATSEGTDPIPGCGNGSRGRSVWYRFTAPSNGTLTADTFGSNYDTILASYTGSCGAFAAVPNGCNDDSGSVQSRVSFTATAGTTYYFLVTAYSNNGGTLVFQLTFQGTGPTATSTPTSPPGSPSATFTPAPPTATGTVTPTSASAFPNDACANAITIAAVPYSGSVVASSATTEASDPVPGCGNGSRQRSAWYRFTAPSTGALTATTLGSNYDTILAVYTGTCGAFTAVPGACNDDSGGAQSRVTFQATAGTTYTFLVTSYSNIAGTLRFNLSQ